MTYDIEPVEIPLFLRRQESHEDHKVPTLSNLRRVPSLSELSDDCTGMLELMMWAANARKPVLVFPT